MATKSFIKTIGSKGLLSDYNTAGKKLQTELIAGDRVTINGSTITADNQIFYAVYGSSTYAEVRAAHDAGKAVFCFNENGMYYLRSVNNSLIAFVRCQVVDSLPNINELYLNNNNEWKKGSNIVCQKRLTFDTTPTAGSTNPVTSDGIKTALNNYVTITKGDSSNFHVKNNEYYSFICRTQFSNWEKMQADFFCPSSDSSTIGKFNIFATLSTTDTSLHTPERVAEFGGIVWDYNYKGYNTINYRIYVAKSGDNFYFYAKRNSSNDKSITAFRSCLLYTTNSSLTDNVSADLDDATWQTLSLVEMTHVYTKATQEDLNKHVNNNIVHLTSEEHNLLNTILTPPASGNAVLKSVNGVLQWVTE